MKAYSSIGDDGLKWQDKNDYPVTTNPLQRIYETLALTSRDVSEDKMVSFLYGVIVGWDDDSYIELQRKHGWTHKDIQLQKLWHESYKKSWNLFIDDESKFYDTQK